MPASYSLDTSPLAFVTLPVVPRFGSDIMGQADHDIQHETDGGQQWTYREYTRREPWKLIFRLTHAQLAEFRAMHDAVDGALNPFYFRLNIEDFDVTLYCRKESGFRPQMLQTPTRPRMFDYTMTLTEELEPEEF